MSEPTPRGNLSAQSTVNLGRSQPAVAATNPRPAVIPLPAGVSRAANCSADKVLCERCNAEMYRMHAVWRCSSCGFKTDCCGW